MPKLPTDPTSISFAVRHGSCFAPRHATSPALSPGFARSPNGSRCRRPSWPWPANTATGAGPR